MPDKKEKKKEVEIEIAGAKIKPEIAYPSPPMHKPTINIEEIKNGYVIKACCGDADDAEFTKNLASAPSIIARLFDVGNKSAMQIEEMMSKRVKDA